ncbi:MAG: tRNA (adenosine(37)-N6)-threonylcarbamoyltransferase complex ATPase subunit type 1 TsaE [Planctomycetota bacterium]
MARPTAPSCACAERGELEIETRDPAATRAVGAALVEAVLPLPSGGLVLALMGDLGAGKTVLVRGIARALGVPAKTPVTSPTFTIARAYDVETPGGALVHLHHLDAYRLRGVEDLDGIGFEEMCGTDCLTCVEWGDRVADGLPRERIDVWIESLPLCATDAKEDAPPAGRRLRFGGRGAAPASVLQRLGDVLARAERAP